MVLFNPDWGWPRGGDLVLGCANATPSFDVARRWRDAAMRIEHDSVPRGKRLLGGAKTLQGAD